VNRPLISLTSLFLLITSFQAFSFQNVDKILADPDITWVGEVYVDYLPNIPVIEPFDPKIVARYGMSDYNIFEILKIQSPLNNDWIQATQNTLSNKLLQLNANDLSVYKEASLTKKLSYKEYQKATKYVILDTVITLDPETFEEIVQVVVNFLTPKDIVLFRVKQILTYNSKTNQLNIIPIAIAPIATTTGRKDVIRNDILFWVPVKEISKHINLEEPSIDWAKRLIKDVSCQSVKTIKGTDNMVTIFDKMLAYYKANPSTSELYYQNYSKNELTAYPASEIKTISSSLDTIITFNAETFEEMVQVVAHEMAPQFAVKIRLIQDWVWDTKTQKMQIRVLGYAPVIKRIDLKPRYSPFYYVKTKP
jgi:hypothetical protein